MNLNRPASDSKPTDRRAFLKNLTLAGAGLAMAATSFAGAVEAVPASARRRRYVIVGVGSRGMTTYQDAVLKNYQQYCEVVALCDTNQGRLELGRRFSLEHGAPEPKLYAAADFDRMLREMKPDYVIVTTPCGTHSDYVVRAMDAGHDVICEKAMATTAAQCQAIIDAKARTGRECRVTFNVRYEPHSTQLKDILMSGAIGDILSADMNWMLDTSHGADYFRRWHSYKANSGGLIIHKASHHFDLINWLIGASPVSVYATGKREFYTPEMGRRLGLTESHERCLTCTEKSKCSFFRDILGEPELKRIYADNEKYDHYIRDKCVFRPDIEIEDTMNVMVRYDNGNTLSYSLNAFCAWEGYRIAFNGTKGRLEHTNGRPLHVTDSAGHTIHDAKNAEPLVRTRIVPLRGAAIEIDPWLGQGSHQGSDKVMLDDIFLPSRPPDKYLRAGNERAGADSILIGAAANQCFVTGMPVNIAEMVRKLPAPRFAPMPSRTGPVPMPPRREA